MTVQDLDRLVTRTTMTPISKQGLRRVRKAIVSGRCGDATVGGGSWSVSIDTEEDMPVRMSFSFKRG
jgi:hypothetical protein